MLGLFRTLLRASTIAVIGMSLAAAGVASGHETVNEADAQHVKKELAEAYDAIEAYAANQREQAYDSAAEALKTADRYIERQQDRISENWSEMSAPARQHARQTMQAIRERRNKAAEWLGSLRTGSTEAWDEIKEGFADAYADLADALVDAEKGSEKSSS